MKYTPGLMVGQLSGKAGNTVASRNRNGSYFRTRVIPKLVRNDNTTAVRASLTALAQAYRELTPSEQAGWISLGSTIKRKNSVGASYNLTGLQAYESINRVLFTLGLSPLSSAPVLAQPEAIADPAVTAVGSGPVPTTTVTAGAASATQTVGSTADMAPGDTLFFAAEAESRVVSSIASGTSVVLTATITTTTGETITITKVPVLEATYSSTPIGASEYLLVYATAPLSAGVTRPAPRAYKLVAVSASGQASPFNFSTGYLARQGSFAAGAKVFVQLVRANNLGFKSGPADNVCIATAP